MLWRLGRYWRTSPLVFSLVPRSVVLKLGAVIDGDGPHRVGLRGDQPLRALIHRRAGIFGRAWGMGNAPANGRSRRP